MSDNASDHVPGMAEAIEARRLEMGLTPGQFAAAAGLTPPGLMPVRRGLRRQYQAKVKLGVARALNWPTDAVDHLLAGEDPADWEDPDPGGVTQIAALAQQLDPEQQAAFAALMRSVVNQGDQP